MSHAIRSDLAPVRRCGHATLPDGDRFLLVSVGVHVDQFAINQVLVTTEDRERHGHAAAAQAGAANADVDLVIETGRPVIFDLRLAYEQFGARRPLRQRIR